MQNSIRFYIGETLKIATIGAICAAPLFLGGCMSAGNYQPVDAPSTVDRALTGVEARLRNPDAAQFRDVRTYQRDGWSTVCGFANGENAYGGMTGYQPFRVTLNASGAVHAVYFNDAPSVSEPCNVR